LTAPAFSAMMNFDGPEQSRHPWPWQASCHGRFSLSPY